MTTRNYSSTAEAKTLSTAINNSATSIVLNSVTTLPSSYPYTLVIDPDTAYEEIVTVTASGGGNILTVVRGQDGTGAQSHTSAAVIRHMITARDLQDAQNHIEATTGGYAITNDGTGSTQNLHGIASGEGAVVGTLKTQTLENKTLTAPIISSPTISGTITGSVITSANIVDGTITSADISDGTIVNGDINASAGITATKLTGTIVQFNNALVGDDFATLAGTEILTNKSIDLSTNTITGTLVQFNTALTTDNFASLNGTETLSNKTLTNPVINGDANSNTEIGTSALNALTTGTSNTALGYNALLSNTEGSSNTAVGSTALDANTTGGSNTAVGNSALGANDTGNFNTAIGRLSMVTNQNGTNNTACGYSSLRFNTTGDYNTAVGDSALENNTTASNNTAIGYQALDANTTGNSNIGIGYAALSSNTTGISNVAVGNQSLFLSTGSNNAAFGHLAADAITTGINNTAIGGWTAYDTMSNVLALSTETTLRLAKEAGNTLYETRSAPATATGTATLSAATLLTGHLVATPTAAATYTLPTGTLLDAAMLGGNAPSTTTFEFVITNQAAFAITIAAGTGHTLSGSATVVASGFARFRFRKTAANTFSVYRVG